MQAKAQAYENHLDAKVEKWFAVYTNYKREKIVEKRLKEKGVQCYLPLQRLVRQYSKRRKIVDLPLMSCYVFVKITKSDYVRVLETEHVLNFVHFSRNLISIPDDEILLLKRILGEELELSVEQNVWEPGDAVEIVQGNLAGLKGKLVERQGKNQFLVEFEKLGYKLLLSLDLGVIRKLSVIRA